MIEAYNCQMISVLIFLVTWNIAYSQTCKTVMEDCWPFVAGYQSLVLNNIRWSRTWIPFKNQPVCSSPAYTNIALSMNSIIWKQSLSNLTYALEHHSLQANGFQLYFYIQQNTTTHTYDSTYMSSYQISYLAIIPGNGVEIQQAVFGSGTLKNTAASRIIYTKTITSSIITTSNPDDYIISTNYRRLNVRWSSNTGFIEPQTQINSNIVKIKLIFPLLSNITQIVMDVIIFKIADIQSIMSTKNYFFQVYLTHMVSSNKTLEKSPQNNASNAFSFTGFNGGNLLQNFQFGWDITQPGLTVDYYQDNFTKINKAIISKVDGTSTYTFTLFRFYKKQATVCSLPTQYLIIADQQCCTACSSPFSSSNNICTRCNSSSYLSASSVCTKCSITYSSACLQCTIYGCLRCNPSSKKQVSEGVCKFCPAQKLYSSITQKCEDCYLFYQGCLRCTAAGCLECNDTHPLNISGSCVSCGNGFYYDFSDGVCKSCTQYHPSCEICKQGQCLMCNVSLKFFPVAITCNLCLDSQYVNVTSKSCYPCNYNIPNCLQCSSQNTCTKCDTATQTELENGSCQCPAQKYFDGQNYKCELCSTLFPDCGTCTYFDCISCLESTNKALIGGICQPCLTNQYSDGLSCHSCLTYNSDCVECNSSTCTVCDPITNKNIVGGDCVTCTSNEFYDPLLQICVTCSSGCSSCTSSVLCSACISGYQINSGLCVPIGGSVALLTFDFQVYTDESTQNALYAYLYFNGSIHLLQYNYQIIFYIDQQKVVSIVQFKLINNTIKAKLKYDQSVHTPTISVVLKNKTSFQILKKMKDQVTIVNIYAISNFQQDIIDILTQGTTAFSQNSGNIFTAFSLTSFGGYFINLLWSIQVASFYIFLPVSKPKILKLFLNTTMSIQQIQLLPFEIPNPFENDQTIIESRKDFQQYEIDLYFIRSNFNDIVSLAIYSCFFVALFLCFRRLQSQNCLIKFLKKRTVQRVYQNISMNFYDVMMTVAFSAASALTSRSFLLTQLVINYFSSILGLLSCFLFMGIQTYLLHRLKDDPQFDNEDCYLGLKHERDMSQIILFMFMASQLFIGILIPLFHPIFTLTILIVLQITNIIVILKFPILKVRVNLYMRILHEFFYIMFNFVFVLLYIIQIHFPDASTNTLTNIGYAAIFIFCLTLICELVEIVAQIFSDLYKFAQGILHKKKIQQIERFDNQMQILSSDKTQPRDSKSIGEESCDSFIPRQKKIGNYNHSISLHIRPSRVKNMSRFSTKKSILQISKFQNVQQAQILDEPSIQVQKVDKVEICKKQNRNQRYSAPLSISSMRSRKRSQKSFCLKQGESHHIQGVQLQIFDIKENSEQVLQDFDEDVIPQTERWKSQIIDDRKNMRRRSKSKAEVANYGDFD